MDNRMPSAPIFQPSDTQNDTGLPATPLEHCNSSRPLVRIFIGPMLAGTAEKQAGTFKERNRWWLGERHRGRDVDEQDVPERIAYKYFLHRGGREEDWGSQENLRRNIKREMLHKFRNNAWSALHFARRGEQVSPKKWIGSSFKIGEDLFGIPLDQPMSQKGSVGVSQRVTDTMSIVPSEGASNQSYGMPYDSVPQQQSPLSSTTSVHNNRISSSTDSEAPLIRAQEILAPRRHSSPVMLLASSSPAKPVVRQQNLHAQGSPVGLSTTDTMSEPAIRPSPLPSTPLKSALQRTPYKGVGRTIQFLDIPSQQAPVSPSEVLARSPSEAPDTSAAAVAAQSQDGYRSVQYGGVIRRERMLVRRSFTRTEKIHKNFNAEDAARLRDLSSYDWKEFLVVWRKNQVELYEDYLLPGKERLLGHKHLVYVIPLSHRDTHTSLYSFIDFSFCLICTTLHTFKKARRTAASLTARIHFHNRPGTDIFVFKTKTRSAAVDWFWELWRYFDGDFPSTFEVHCPAIDTRVKLRIPSHNKQGDDACKPFTREKVIDICRESLKKLPSWEYLIEPALRKGFEFQLCWRRDTMLDWIYWEKDIEDMDRPWAAVYGLALMSLREITHLELRLGQHRPVSVAKDDGYCLYEPPGVEGYLYRIRPTSHIRAQVYLVTHSGCLFTINPPHAHPPRPPLPTDERSFLDSEEDGYFTKPFRDQEVERGAQQVFHANSFIDLRNIAAIRRVFQHEMLHTPHEAGSMHEDVQRQRQMEQEDWDDEGGDDVLAKHPNKLRLRSRRSFELLMRSGHVVRFETHSCSVAQEWVERLGALIEYWSQRHRSDAALEMKILEGSVNGTGPVTVRVPHDPTRVPPAIDPEEATDNLPVFWNWCIIERCLPIIRCGRIFFRRELRGQYSLIQLILVSGHLILFHIAASQATHHFRSMTISLLDAYVCSGHYATQSLPIGEFSSTQPPLPRRFQDGLESDDHELDTVFLIWHHPHATSKTMSSPSNTVIPSTKAKHKIFIMKARSKLERDSWCWALNAEIERLTRETRDRELKSRESGLA